MAVAPTGAIYKAMTIDGESSRTYGVYITGQAVYNAPAREVEMISIPGRNGQLALDKGRFENIEVTYPAGIYADTEEDFAEAVSNFRNFLCSIDGYVRIEDEYNPNEYRMGVYKSGLEVTPAMLKAGEFDITFDCKPQRWLKSGENAITVESGDVIANPTLFESSPLLEVTDGEGNISFNGYNVLVSNYTYGDVELYAGRSGVSFQIDVPFNAAMANDGDVITINKIGVQVTTPAENPATFLREEVDGSGFEHSYSLTENQYGWGVWNTEMTNIQIPVYDNVDLRYKVIVSQTDGPTMQNEAGRIRVLKLFTDDHIRITANFTLRYYMQNCMCSPVILHSTKSVLTDIFIDCDLGEAYKVEDGQYISLNRYIDLGSDLPKLSTGANSFEIDNTITGLKVIPRWWKV